MEEELPPEALMFYCGAQTSADGDLLPGSFSVFYNGVSIQAACEIVMKKITDELLELDIHNADGSMSFVPINSWQDFADIELDDQVKTTALVEAMIASSILVLHNSAESLIGELQTAWAKEPEPDEAA